MLVTFSFTYAAFCVLCNRRKGGVATPPNPPPPLRPPVDSVPNKPVPCVHIYQDVIIIFQLHYFPDKVHISSLVSSLHLWAVSGVIRLRSSAVPLRRMLAIARTKHMAYTPQSYAVRGTVQFKPAYHVQH